MMMTSRGKGYTTEAMKEILSFARKELQIKEVVGRYAKENPRSERKFNAGCICDIFG